MTDAAQAVPLELVFDRVPAGEFTGLLQGGFGVELGGPCSIASLLRGVFGERAGEVSARIGTLFLDGQPVDDPEEAQLGDGSSLSLSAAMPGLAGAVLRRGGSLASFRGAITYRAGDVRRGRGAGTVTVKLFNLLIAELGPAFLARGVLVPSPAFREWAAGKDAAFWSSCRSATADGAPAASGEVPGGGWLKGRSTVRLVARGTSGER